MYRGALTAVLLSAVSLSACKREPAPEARPAETASQKRPVETASLNGPARLVEGPVAKVRTISDVVQREKLGLRRPVPAASQTAGTAAPAELGDLRKFSGFSADETRYAFSVFSEGAGFHLLHVVNAAGETIERFQLPDDAHVEKAREWLKSQGFSPRAGELAGNVRERLKATVRQGKVLVTGATSGGGEEKVLYQADPFAREGGGGKPTSAELAQVAPSGKRVAVKVSQAPVTEFGGITTYVIVDVTPVLGGAK